MIIKKGTSLSGGIAIGSAVTVFRNKLSVKGYKVKDTDKEINKLNEAVSNTSKFFDQLQLLSKTYKELHDVYKMLLTDESFIGKTVFLIESEKLNAEYALKKVTDSFLHKLSLSGNEYLKAKMHDIKDIYMRLQFYMSDTPFETFEDADKDSILIFDDFAVDDIDCMIKKHIKGFASRYGSKISHKSIIVRESGIAAVSGISNPDKSVKTGDIVIIDGFMGRIIINPNKETLERYEKKKADYNNFINSFKIDKDASCKTADGENITLLANINNNDELTHINVHGLHGIGLYRTEFLYIKEGAISEEMNYRLLSNALSALKGKPLTVRTFDLGGDKISRFMPHNVEENPALGLRAIRYSMKYSEFFAAQIRAVLRAGLHGDIRLMFPMISSVDELLEVKEFINQEIFRLKELRIPHKDNIPIGIMIELPSAALSIEKLVKYADFFSVGTNDLIQYTIGVDRNNDNVSYLYSPAHPAVISMLENICDVVLNHGKEVSICGEMASESRYICVLLGMGYRTFSMSPKFSYMARRIISSLSAEKCREFVQTLKNCDRIEEIEDAISNFNDNVFFNIDF
ncbi:MAG: phosphoenolpyruvate--protein phosphotransferase [Mucispirillum sp.]|nr:phosphoenolpyruvate--protein phosphotransferase [Mucispirillum sp.]